MFEYIVDNFRKNSKFINDLDGVNEYLISQNLSSSDMATILRKTYEYNETVYSLLVEENNKLEKIISTVKNKKELKKLPEKSTQKEIVPMPTEINAVDISFYIYQINKCKSIDCLDEILPKVTSNNYTDTINCILLRLLKEAFDIKKMLYEDRFDIDSDTKMFFENEYELLKYKIEYIKNITKNITKKKEIEESEPENRLVFLKTNYGNICAFSDLKISIEYYDQIYELLESIRLGTFKGVKTFTNNNVLQGLSEVRGEGTRVIFDKIGKNTYVIIYIFIKRVDRSASYIASLQNRSELYHYNESSIRSLVETSESYLEENNQIYEDIKRMLLTKGKSKVKGDDNE